MTNSDQPVPKPKKSVALSGVVAGNTAICSVGHAGNDLHYRGYNVLDFARSAEFEEIAYLLIYGSLPDATQLTEYKSRLRSIRELPDAVKNVLEFIPESAHPMDVLRTGCSMMGHCYPETEERSAAEARALIDRLMATAA